MVLTRWKIFDQSLAAMWPINASWRLLLTEYGEVLPSLNNPSQSTFIHARQIQDSILLAHELGLGYHGKRITPRGSVKIDLQKSFDSIHWDFLINLCLAFEFPLKAVRWIQECVTSPYFSIALNGSLARYFPGSREIWQGDPLSPYLFVITVDYLSSLLDSATQGGLMGFHPRCKGMPLTHLCFADDLLIFFDNMTTSLSGIITTLTQFY